MARVLLVHPDVRWAFDRMARDIRRFAQPDDNVVVVGQRDFEAVVKFAGPKAFGRLDAAFHFSLGSASLLRRVDADRRGTLVANECHCFAEYDPADWRTNGCAPERNAAYSLPMLEHLDFVICLTDRIHKTVAEYNENAVMLPQGVNTRFWRPAAVADDSPNLAPMTVGWCGDTTTRRTFKGFEEMFVPLQNRLNSNRGIQFSANVSDHTSASTRRAMRDWYRKLGAFVCTAINEGGPYPPFEAALCGVPVVSTDVGIVSTWDALREAGMIVPAYHNDKTLGVSLNAMIVKLVTLAEDAKLRQALGAKLRASVLENYSWEDLAPKWIDAMVGR